MQNMKDFDQLMSVWKQQDTVTVPTAETIIVKAKKEQNAFTKKIRIQIITLLVTLACLIAIGIVIPFKMITTYIGLAIMYLCILGFSAVRTYQMQQLKKINLTQNPAQTLQDLQKVVQFQQFVGNTVSKLYFIFLNLAFVFYFIEVLHPMSILVKSIVLSIYVIWMLFAFFYLGKKQKEK